MTFRKNFYILSFFIVSFFISLCFAEKEEKKTEEPKQEAKNVTIKKETVIAPIRESIIRFPVDNYSKKISQSFGNYLGYYKGRNYNGYHGGEDIAVSVGTPVYPITKGRVAQIYEFTGLGHLVAIEHEGLFFIPARSETDKGQLLYQYPQDKVTRIYSVYVHIKPISSLKVGHYVEPDKLIGTIAKTNLPAHLHFEIRLPNEKHSKKWELFGDSDNWSTFPGTNEYTGYYKNSQKMVDAGLRDPSEFIRANFTPNPITSIVGKYVGKTKSREEITLELKEDGTALGSGSLAWEVVWYPTDDPPHSPCLTLYIFEPNGDTCFSFLAGNGKEPIHATRGSIRVDFWHIFDDVLKKGEGAEIIKLNNVRDPISEEKAFYPDEVSVWSRYIGKIHGGEEVFELKRIPNYTPPGWKRLVGSHGPCIRYSFGKWEVSGNKLKLSFECEGKVETTELEIEGNTLIDKKWGVTFVRQK